LKKLVSSELVCDSVVRIQASHHKENMSGRGRDPYFKRHGFLAGSRETRQNEECPRDTHQHGKLLISQTHTHTLNELLQHTN